MVNTKGRISERLRMRIIGEIKKGKKTSSEIAAKWNLPTQAVAAIRAHMTRGTYA